MAGDLFARFLHLLLELRERDLKPYERLAAEEILLLTYGEGRTQVVIRRLDHLAARLGISRGNLHPHLSQLVRLQVLANDERPGKHAETWWFNEPGVWQIGRRIEFGSERDRRAAAATAALQDDNPLLPGQRELPGFEPEQTDAEVQADAALERTGQNPTSNLSAAALASARSGQEAEARSKIWNGGSKIWNELVPKSGTAVPKSGTGEVANAPTCARARPGSRSLEPEARLARLAVPPSAEAGSLARNWRPLTDDEAALLSELEAWCAEGPDTLELIERHRAVWEGRIRGNGGLVERVLRDGQTTVREQPDVIKRSRGGLLKTLYNDWLRGQPQRTSKIHARARPAQTGAPHIPALAWEESQQRVKKLADGLRLRLKGGMSGD